MRRSLILVVVLVLVAVFATPALAGKGPTKSTALNARFVSWQESDAIVHLLVFPDAGRGGTEAVVDLGQPLLFGFELSDEGDTFPDAFPIEVSVDGGPFVSADDWYFPVVGDWTGPAWAWDHDNDGRGDGDGDGIGDWPEGPLLFFRYPLAGFTTLGAHQVAFSVDLGDGFPFEDVISLTVVP